MSKYLYFSEYKPISAYVWYSGTWGQRAIPLVRYFRNLCALSVSLRYFAYEIGFCLRPWFTGKIVSRTDIGKSKILGDKTTTGNKIVKNMITSWAWVMVGVQFPFVITIISPSVM